ncbi:MAG: M16 family metallopeptidase [Candidatus Micrarchaeia archaeon]
MEAEKKSEFNPNGYRVVDSGGDANRENKSLYANILRRSDSETVNYELMQPTKLYKLNNGLRVIIHQIHGIESAAVVFGVNYGAIDDSARKNGAAHYLEHMIFRGIDTKPWNEVNANLSNIGGYWNANTDFEATVFYIVSHKSQIDKAAKLLADMLYKASISENNMEVERKIIMAENRDDDLSLANIASNSLIKMIFRNYPVRRLIGGSNSGSLKHITRQDLIDIYEKYYNPSNMALAIYGAVDESKALRIAEKYFSDQGNSSAEPKRSICKEKQKKDSETILLKEKDNNIAGVGRGFMVEGLALNPEEYAHLRVLETLLYNKIYEEIREKQGLSYSPTVDVVAQSLFGYIIIFAAVNPANVAKAGSILDKELEKFEKLQISKEDVDLAKQQAYLRARMAFDYIPEMPIGMVIDELTMHKYYLPLIKPKLIKNVSKKDIEKLCDKYLKLENAAFLVIEPKT